MIFIKFLLLAGLSLAGLFIIKSLINDNRKTSTQTPINLVTLANELWLKNSGRVAANREKGSDNGSANSPVAADFKVVKKVDESRTERMADEGNGADEENSEPDEDGFDSGNEPTGQARGGGVEHRSISAFREEFIEPHAYFLTEQKADAVIENLLGILAEHAGLSSIVVDKTDEEYLELVEVAQMLGHTKLITHTETVTRLMIETGKETYSEWEKMIPALLVAALGHDIGKIHEGNHPKRSAEMLSELIPEDAAWKRQVLNAVAVHHGEAAGQLASLLKAADMKARGYELAAAMPGTDLRPFEGWFNGGEFIKKYIEPEVNITQMHTCNAFSLNGVVYVKAEYLYEAAHNMSKDVNVIDIRFFYPSERDNVLRGLVKALRDGGYVHDSLKHDMSTAKYELVPDKPSMKKLTMQLVPLKGTAFDLNTAEVRKTDFLVGLKELKPVGKGNG